jgi:hypothetical protein
MRGRRNAKSDYQLLHMSVLSHATARLRFYEILYFLTFRKSVKNAQVLFKPGKNHGSFT